MNVRRKAKKGRWDITSRNGKERCKTEKTKWDKHEIVGWMDRRRFCVSELNIQGKRQCGKHLP